MALDGDDPVVEALLELKRRYKTSLVRDECAACRAAAAETVITSCVCADGEEGARAAREYAGAEGEREAR